MPETSKTANQALTILEVIADNGAQSIADLAREMELSRTVVYRLLTTLEVHGLVSRSHSMYRLGPKLFALVQHVERAIRDAARLPMADLADKLRETVVLTVRDGLDAVSAERIVGADHILQVNYPPGLRHPLTMTASGRVILAFASPEERHRAAEAANLDHPALESELVKIRKQGFASSSSEYQQGLAGLAAPIRSTDGVIASIAVVAPLDRSDVLKAARRDLLGAAEVISAELIGE